jgi:alkanesulfonate monooxygenase SsuD/methylene tetrahydromethanopterin reductase-like flavin-dependent oxidoreductase (luciferase family)
MGVNVPNFGPGTEPGVLRRWAQTVEGLGFDLLMVSGHIAVTPDVAEQYPAPFYEPFTTLAWLADALGVPFARRGKLTDDYLRAVRAAWEDDENYRGGQIRIWVGGNSDAGLRRAVRLGEAWHPLRFTLPWLREAVRHMAALADELGRPVPGLAPRIALRLAETRVTDPAVSLVRERSTRSSMTSHSCACSAPTPSCSIRSAAIRGRRIARRRPGRRSRRSQRQHATWGSNHGNRIYRGRPATPAPLRGTGDGGR